VLTALKEGCEVYVVVDASGDVSKESLGITGFA